MPVIYIYFSLEQHIQLSYFQTQIKAKPKGLLCFQLGKKKLQTGPTYIVNFILTSYD